MTKPVQLTNDFWLKEIILNGNPKLDEFYKEDLIKMINTCKEQNLKYKKVFNKTNVFLDNHDKNAGKLYYKYDNKYLLSEIKEDIRDILKEVK